MSHLLPADVEILPAKQFLIHSLLHAMGQPLSALQMCVLLRDRGASTDLPSVLLDDVADQVTTLSRLFSSLRELLSEIPTPQPITPAEVVHFAAASLPKWQQLAASRQLELDVEFPLAEEPRELRLASLHPWQHSFFQIVEAALMSASPHETVRLQAHFSASADLAFSLQGGVLLSDSSHTARYTLPVASVLLEAPERSFTYSLRPFAATLTFRQVSSPDDASSADAVHRHARTTA